MGQLSSYAPVLETPPYCWQANSRHTDPKWGWASWVKKHKFDSTVDKQIQRHALGSHIVSQKKGIKYHLRNTLGIDWLIVHTYLWKMMLLYLFIPPSSSVASPPPTCRLSTHTLETNPWPPTHHLPCPPMFYTQSWVKSNLFDVALKALCGLPLARLSDQVSIACPSRADTPYFRATVFLLL